MAQPDIAMMRTNSESLGPGIWLVALTDRARAVLGDEARPVARIPPEDWDDMRAEIERLGLTWAEHVEEREPAP